MQGLKGTRAASVAADMSLAPAGAPAAALPASPPCCKSCWPGRLSRLPWSSTSSSVLAVSPLSAPGGLLPASSEISCAASESVSVVVVTAASLWSSHRSQGCCAAGAAMQFFDVHPRTCSYSPNLPGSQKRPYRLLGPGATVALWLASGVKVPNTARKPGGEKSTTIEELSMPFADLCATHALMCRVDTQTRGLLRGLVTTSRAPAGEPVLAVPWDLVLSTAVSVEAAPHRVASHHLEVARAMLMALSEAGGGRRARFWQQWRDLLPQPSELTVPAALPELLLRDLQDSIASDEARRALARVEAHFGCATGGCDDAHWAVALTRSRPFTLPPAAPSPAVGRDIFAFVPFVDMANHATDPSCEVRGVGSYAEPRQYTAVELVALRDLAAGETVTIDCARAAARTWHRPARLIPRSRCLRFVEHVCVCMWVGGCARARAWADGLSDDLPQHQFADFGFLANDAPLGAPGDVHWSRLAQRSTADFTTTLGDDEALLRQLQSAGPSEAADPRMLPVVAYRVHAKRTIEAARLGAASHARPATTPAADSGADGGAGLVPTAIACAGALAVAVAATVYWQRCARLRGAPVRTARRVSSKNGSERSLPCSSR